MYKTSCSFLKEWTYWAPGLNTLLNTFENDLKKAYICGDFNLWFDDEKDPYVKHISDLMDSINFENMINAPTSLSHHILDVLFCEQDLSSIRNVVIEPDFSISYFHKFITFGLDLVIKDKMTKKIIFRNKSLMESNLLIENGIRTFHLEKLNKCDCNVGENLEPLLKSACSNCFADLYREVFSTKYDNMCPLT